MGDAIQRVIDNSKVANMQVFTRSKQEQETEKAKREDEKKNQSVIASILNAKQDEDNPVEGDKLADGFVRSKRNMALRVKDEMNNQVSDCEQEKTELIQKLNHALVKLDKLNTKNREMSNILVEKIKFVRDLQKATSGGDDIEGIISNQMKEEFRREQQINHRLREEIKKCEMDRLRIMDRLNLLSGQKQIVIQTSDGLHKTYKVTNVNIQRLLEDLQHFKQDANNKQDIVNQETALVSTEEYSIRELEQLIAEQRRLRDQAGEATAEQQFKWDSTIGEIEREIHRKNKLHDMHVKLCATRHFEESMQKILRRNKQITFDWFQATIVGNYRKFGAIWKLRTMFLANNTKRKKNALSRWFKIACDPVALIRLNNKIPELYAANIAKNYFFNKWKLVKAKRQMFDLNKKLKLQKMWFKLNRYWKRRMKVNFQCWRDKGKQMTHGVRKLYQLLNEQRYLYLTHAFMKWRSYKENQDLNVRLHALSISLSITRYQSQILNAWRNQTQNSKQKRQLLLRQAFKCLQVNKIRNKHFKTLAIAAFTINKQGKNNITKQCFDALRHNSAQGKLMVLTNKLVNDTKPAITALNFKINNQKRKMDQEGKKRSTNVMVTCFGKLLSRYFHHWKDQSTKDTLSINTTLKMRIIKLHRDSMQRAFNLWRNGRSNKIITMQMEEIQDMQAGNMQIEEESRNVERSIQEKVQSVRSSASKKMSKLVTNAFKNNLQAYFRKWHSNVAHRNNLQANAGLIQKKLYKRLVRVGWQKYKRGFECMVQEVRFEKRTIQIKERLDFKTKKRIYNAICGYVSNHVSARTFMKNLLKRLDKHNKQTALNLWKADNFNQTVEKLTQNQAQQVGNITELQNMSGQVGDELNALKESNKKLEKALSKQGEKTLQKWVVRSISSSLKYYFQTWKGVQDDEKHKQKLLMSTLNHINRVKLRYCFIQWKQTQAIQEQMFMEELIMTEEMENGCVESAITMQNKERKVVADQSSRIIAQVNKQETVAATKTGEIILKVIKLNDQNNFMSKRRACFYAWREQIRNRKKCCKILHRAVFMMLVQRTFTEIRDFQRNTDHDNATKKASTRIFRLWNKCLLKKAFNKWRVEHYHSIRDQISSATQTKSNNTDEFLDQLAKARGSYANVKFKRLQKSQLQQMFDGWAQYSQNLRNQRLAALSTKENTGTMNIKKALLKWRMRKEMTVKMRNLTAKGKLIKKHLNLSSVFKAWKRELAITKRMCCRVDQVMTMLVNTQKQRTFNLVKGYSINRFGNINKRKGESKKRMIAIFQSYNDGRMRRAIVNLKAHADQKSDALVRFKSILTLNSVRSQRRMFMKWKMKAQENEVEMQNEYEDGPVSLECFALRQQNKNLEKLLLQDGSTPKQIEKLQENAENKFKSYVEQSLCRLLCKAEPDLQLLPFFLDRWKKFTKTRQIWKRILHQCNHRQSRDTTMTSKLWAFQKWKYSQCDRENQLIKIPFHQLQKQCVQTVEKLELLADTFEATEEVRQGYLQQRNELLGNQISGQRLAFALAKANQERAKQTAMTRWIEGGNAILKAKIQDALMKNLDKISELKNRIDSIEYHNDVLAEQNDTYRQGAMDGILMAKHCDELHEERESLSVDLADKAITIRKLLEDNSYLHNKVVQAKETNQRVMKDLASSMSQDRPQRDNH